MAEGTYRGIVRDRMSGIEHKTKYYNAYQLAHQAAERLAKRHYTDDRYDIDVE